jgi:hypothetical protein
MAVNLVLRAKTVEFVYERLQQIGEINLKNYELACAGKFTDDDDRTICYIFNELRRYHDMRDMKDNIPFHATSIHGQLGNLCNKDVNCHMLRSIFDINLIE